MEINTERLCGSMLTLQCAKCTRTRTFGLEAGLSSFNEGRAAIARAGWIQRGELMICPRCPQTRAEITERVAIGHPIQFEETGEMDMVVQFAE